MTQGSKKAGSGKRVRIATTLTGAGTGQPALAGTRHQAGIRPDGLGVDRGCPAGTQHWLHLATYDSRVKDWCIGGHGLHFFVNSPTVIDGFCGGNNSGVIYGEYLGSPPLGQPSTYIFFGPGWRYRGTQLFRASIVSISHWGGSESCGPP
jgi:hypothetical protein